MSDTHKLRIRIGDAEFEAEGSESSVKAQYDAFLQALAAQGAAEARAPAAPGSAPKDHIEQNGEPDESAGVDEALIEKAYLLGKDGLVSLKYLPKSDQREADALLLILFGYTTLKQADAVLGTQLTRAARQSGISIDRVDRALAKHDTLLLKGGARKGVKYSLNNQGRVKAQEMLKQMLT